MKIYAVEFSSSIESAFTVLALFFEKKDAYRYYRHEKEKQYWSWLKIRQTEGCRERGWKIPDDEQIRIRKYQVN